MGMNVQISLEPSHAIFKALEEGKIDVLMGVAYTETREKTYDFSPPHTMVVFSLFGRKDGPPISSMESWQDKDVMALKHAVINETAVEQGWNSLTFVDSDEEMLRLLASGKHDYALLATKVGVHLIQDLGLNINCPHCGNSGSFQVLLRRKKGEQPGARPVYQGPRHFIQDRPAQEDTRQMAR
jgi:polar amino acid transport system substrate-binding protein